MMLHRIQESQETIKTQQNIAVKERKVLDSLDFFEQKSSVSQNGCIDVGQNEEYCQSNKLEKQNQMFKVESNNTNYDYHNSQNNKTNKCNYNMLINLFHNQSKDMQNKNNGDCMYVKSPIGNSTSNTEDDTNESNCTTNILFQSMNDKIPYNMFKKVLNADQDEQNNMNITKNVHQQYQENREFDIFSFVPLKMKQKNNVQQENKKEDHFEIDSLFIKQKNLSQLNNVVEQAESIVVDLSDRDDDFSSISSQLDKNNSPQQLPLILQPCFLVQNTNQDKQLQNELDLLPFSSKDSHISLDFLHNDAESCQFQNSFQMEENQLPQIKRLFSEPQRVSMQKDKKKISAYSKKSSSPKIQRIQSKKSIQKLKSEKKQNKKQIICTSLSS